MLFEPLSQTSICTGFYVHVKRIVAAQHHTQIKGIESERINLKEDNYGNILLYIFNE